ncbi:MAG: hypothetical protein KME20_17965 [Kaiparowitsia implicata GSE-PSE-MK54-09C]|jgi:uncharacterized membrane protein|nr:hypothetical protein [Kaiparowitsia implicata GSE-PSE-MK54-09C]
MTWRGTTTPKDRILSCLVYLLPLLDSVALAGPFMRQVPELSFLFTPLMPLFILYATIPFFGLIVFFGLFALVVRNPNIPHFVRFNTMQALLLGIVGSLFRLLLDWVLEPILRSGLILDTLYNVGFLAILTAVIFAVVQSVRGMYAEIPSLSEVVHRQVQ